MVVQWVHSARQVNKHTCTQALVFAWRGTGRGFTCFSQTSGRAGPARTAHLRTARPSVCLLLYACLHRSAVWGSAACRKQWGHRVCQAGLLTCLQASNQLGPSIYIFPYSTRLLGFLRCARVKHSLGVRGVCTHMRLLSHLTHMNAPCRQ